MGIKKAFLHLSLVSILFVTIGGSCYLLNDDGGIPSNKHSNLSNQCICKDVDSAPILSFASGMEMPFISSSFHYPTTSDWISFLVEIKNIIDSLPYSPSSPPPETYL